MANRLTQAQIDHRRQLAAGSTLAALAGAPIKTSRFDRRVKMSMDDDPDGAMYDGDDTDQAEASGVMKELSDALSQMGIEVEPAEDCLTFLQHLLVAVKTQNAGDGQSAEALARPEPEVVSMSMSATDRAHQEAGGDALIALCGVRKRR